MLCSRRIKFQVPAQVNWYSIDYKWLWVGQQDIHSLCELLWTSLGQKSLCDPTCLLCIHWNVPFHFRGEEKGGMGAVEGVYVGEDGGGHCWSSFKPALFVWQWEYLSKYLHLHYCLFMHRWPPHMLRMAGRGAVTSQGESVMSDTKSVETYTWFCATCESSYTTMKCCKLTMYHCDLLKKQ